MVNPDILNQLRSFEGASATFQAGGEEWTLWLPEFPTEEHPLTPASQIFFRVILRRGGDTISIRFFYDCGKGRIRYYTSAIPEGLAGGTTLGNALGELFRHTFPVEPVHSRTLTHSAAPEDPRLPRTARRRTDAALADAAIPIDTPLPAAVPKVRVTPAAETPAPADSSPPRAPDHPAASSAPARSDAAPSERSLVAERTPQAPAPSAPAAETVTLRRERPRLERTVRIEIGPGLRTVLLSVIAGILLLAVAAMGLYAYLQSTRDPGLEHHRLQLEAMKLQSGR